MDSHGLSVGRRVQRGEREHRRRDHDPADDRVAERRYADARCRGRCAKAAYALGATKLDVTVKVVLPAAVSGIVASFLLALSRAIGETMAVALAAGNRPKLTLNPLESMQTMTAYIVQISQGDTPAGTLEYRTIFAVGLALFVTTMALNVLAQWFVSRMREKYE